MTFRMPAFDAGRRTVLTGMASLAATAAVTSGVRAAVAARVPAPAAPTFHAFTIGSFRAMSISDGALVVEPLFPTMALNATEAEFDALAVQRFLDPKRDTLHMNHLVVDTGRNLVLVDPGGTTALGPHMGALPANLRAAGVDPRAIDTVIISHAHPDHVLATTDAAGGLAFPNATYHVSAAEWGFWTSARPDLSGLGLPDDFKSFITSTAKTSFAAIGERVQMIEGDKEIVPGVHALPTPGHSPGHLSLVISDGGDTLVHTTDVVHHSVTALAHPEWQPVFDQDRERAVQTRLKLLDRLATDRTLTLVYHFPFPGIGHVSRRQKGYNWEPATWTW